MPKRRKSLESSEDSSKQNLKVIVNKRQKHPEPPPKVIAHFMPRRRFSQGSVSVLKDILENLEVKDGEEKEEEKDTIDPEEFSSLSREEQLKVVFIDISKNLISLLLDFRAKVLGKKHRLQPGQFPGNNRSRRI